MKTVITFLCLITFSTVQAQDIYQNDINSMLYVKVKFGGEQKASRDDSLKLGFTVNHTYTAMDRMGGMSLLSNHSYHHSLMDVEFSSRTKYFSKFNIGGIDALTYRTVMNANGEAIQWPMGLSTPQVVAGAILGVALGAYVAGGL